MNAEILTGSWTGDGNAAPIELGAVPHHVQVVGLTATNPTIIDWFSRQEDDEATNKYGQLTAGASGIVTYATTAATGISELKSESTGVLIDSPKDSDLQVFTTVADWVAATDYSSAGTARTATAIGTVVRPPTHNNRVFELTTATGVGTSEPTGGWDVQPGETVTDGGSNVWTCRQENVTKDGVMGFTVGATAQTDGIVYYYKALVALEDDGKGNADDF
jgi:hypothetical protein